MTGQRQENTPRLSEEFRGKTIEAAINAGLAALQLSRDEVEIEIVRAGSRGVLGIGAEDAIVRLTVLPRPGSVPEPEWPTSPQPGAMPELGPTTPQAKLPSPGSVARPEDMPAKPASARKSRSSRSEPKQYQQPRVTTTQSTGEALAGTQPELATDLAPRAGPKAPGEPPGAQAGRPGPAPVTGKGGPAWPPVDEVEPSVDDKAMAAAQEGQKLLVGLLERMNLRADVDIIPQSDAEADEGERVQALNIVGENLGILIGRQNEVLAALELVTRLMVNQRIHIRSDFIVDVNGYRGKRAESLRKLALRMADQAVQTGRTMVLEPMPPAERRIIHLTLRDHPKVTTQSVGEGDRRKVTVVPKRD